MDQPIADGPPRPRLGARTTQRRGRMSDAKRAALADLGPRWMLGADQVLDPVALTAAFGRDAPRLLDVGGGTGEATTAWARARPDADVVALELHRPGLVQLVRGLEDGGPANVRAAEVDVTAVLHGAAPATFAEVRILFPDPWPKRRHLTRRLVDTGFVTRIVDLVAVGGRLHLATDWAPYADQMRQALATDARLEADLGPSGVPEGPADADRWVPVGDVADRVAPASPDGPPAWCSPRPDRPVTRYERRGLDAGRTVVDLVVRRRS